MFPFKPAEGSDHSGISTRVDEVSDCSSIKILTPKQILQRLPRALAPIKTGNTSENLLNEILYLLYFTYFLYRAKEVTKQANNNIMNSINV